MSDFSGKAAGQGDVSAKRNLGILYCFGLGVCEDTDKARELFQKAADQGDKRAEQFLKDCF